MEFEQVILQCLVKLISILISFTCLQIFDLFDVNRNGFIDFSEFVRSLNTFHPRTPVAEKIACKECDP